jgi:hypothetical protein
VVKLVHCGPPRWSALGSASKELSFVYESDDGRHRAEVVMWHDDAVILYPKGVVSGVNAGGIRMLSLISAQLRAMEIVGAE